MACSASSSPTQPYRSEDLKRMQWLKDHLPDPKKVALLCFEEPNHKDLKSRVAVVLSNTIRNVDIMETTRVLAIVGLFFSAVASVLLPALGFAAIAAGACALKNRAIQLDAKDLQDSAAATEEVLDRTLTSSPSIVSQTSQEKEDLTTMSRTRSTTTTSMGLIEEHAQEESSMDIKEVFLNSLGDRDNLSIEQLYRLLTISYYFLAEIADMPEQFTKKDLLSSKINTQAYFERKYKDCLAKTSEEFKGSVTLDNEGRQILAVNEKQKSLESANPSLIMETVQELHRQISREQYKYKNKTEANHHTDKAKHAGEYIAQLKKHEFQKNLHFTEDANYS